MRQQEIVLPAGEYLLTCCEWFLRREEIRLKHKPKNSTQEHIDTSLIQLMFILLDTGYSSSFENDALKIPAREKINP